MSVLSLYVIVCMCDCYVSALFVVKSYLDNVLSDILTCLARFLL
jgi:hypothetical protein